MVFSFGDGQDLAYFRFGQERIHINEDISFDDLVIKRSTTFTSMPGLEDIVIHIYYNPQSRSDYIALRFFSGDRTTLTADDFLFGKTFFVSPQSDEGDAKPDSKFILGTSDADVLHGGGGDDFLWGSTGNDRLYGGDGDDEIYGGLGDNVLEGGKGDDVLYGQGNDRLYGGDGDDDISAVLEGGKGNDTLSAGLGNDVFVFSFGDGHDIVSNLHNRGEKDTIRIKENISFDDLVIGTSILGGSVVYYNPKSRDDSINLSILPENLTPDDFLFGEEEDEVGEADHPADEILFGEVAESIEAIQPEALLIDDLLV